MSEAIIEALRRRYMESVGNPARQLIGGGVRGYLGLDQPEYADQLGREAYANAQALGNAPGIGAPAGAFKAMAAAPLMVKALRNAPRSEALETARQNAVKMLGLPENNTAMDRARALGFDVNSEFYHATSRDFVAPNPSVSGKLGPGFYVARNPRYAERYGGESPQVMPVYTKGNFASGDVQADVGETIRQRMYAENPNFAVRDWKNNIAETLRKKGYAGSDMDAERVVLDPVNVRSRFAAFDPARVNENDLLGRADPRLLGLIAAGTATGATVAALRNKKEDEKKKKDQ